MLYDGLDRVASVTQPEGGIISFSYSPTNPWPTMLPPRRAREAGLAAGGTHHHLLPTIRSYNKATSVTDPLGLVTTMGYDRSTGNLVNMVTDAGGAGHLSAMRASPTTPTARC